MNNTYKAIDLFCGAGGSSRGIEQANIEVVAGFDMWETAGLVYMDNFPNAWFYQGNLESFSVNTVSKELGNIDLIVASPECTNHSPARGNKFRCNKSKETAFQVIRYAKVFRPRWLVIENVVSMRNWDRYEEFIEKLGEKGLGYNISEYVFDSSDFGIPQSRRRLFIICDLNNVPRINISKPKKKKSAKGILCEHGDYKFTPLRKEKRAAATLERAARAINCLGKKEDFLIVYYGSDAAGGWQSLERPLRTITTLDRFAYVRPKDNCHEMRMLQIPELKLAMGMEDHLIEHGTRRDGIKMLGNGVCPPVMKKIVSTLVRN